MQKIHAIMESTGTQIRPILNAQQQAKFDAEKKAHQDMMNAMKEMHDARSKKAVTRKPREMSGGDREVAAASFFLRDLPYWPACLTRR